MNNFLRRVGYDVMNNFLRRVGYDGRLFFSSKKESNLTFLTLTLKSLAYL